MEEEGEGGASILLSLPKKIRQRIEAVNSAVADLRGLLEEELEARREKPTAEGG